MEGILLLALSFPLIDECSTVIQRTGISMCTIYSVVCIVHGVVCVVHPVWCMGHDVCAMLFCCTGIGKEVHCVLLGVYMTKWDS